MTRRLGLVGLALVVSGCATMQAPGASPSAHRERAQQFEREGFLRRALDEYKIAGVLDAGDSAAREGQRRLEARIEGLVAERINEGRAALSRGSHVEAQRRLLMALALDPGNRTALTLLQNEVRDVESVNHTVRAGETLAGLAERYYGDRSRSEVIWEANQLPPNPRLTAGTTLKIPEIPGMPFPRARREPPPALPPPGAIANLPPPAAPSRPEPARPEPGRPEPGRVEPGREEGIPEVNPLVAEAREALDRNDYAGALTDLDKLARSDPGNREGADLRKLVLYRQGRAQLDQKNYDASVRTLTMLAKLQPDYEDVSKLLQQTRGRAVEQHYQTGIRLYREEKLPEAIAEWKLVLDMDPQHSNAKRNIEQAERLLKGLEQRKKK